MKSPTTDPAALDERIDVLLNAMRQEEDSGTLLALSRELCATAVLWKAAHQAAPLVTGPRPPTDYGLARDAWVWLLAALVGLGAGAMGYFVAAAFRGG
jgi:drug/metabolite transporter (DMT)-like permease